MLRSAISISQSAAIMSGENLISTDDSQLLNSVGEAIEQWMGEISSEEHRQRHLHKIQEQIGRTLDQVRYEGLLSCYDFEKLKYIGQNWCVLVSLLTSASSEEETEKDVRGIICCLLRLYDCGQITKDLFGEVIITSLQ